MQLVRAKIQQKPCLRSHLRAPRGLIALVVWWPSGPLEELLSCNPRLPIASERSSPIEFEWLLHALEWFLSLLTTASIDLQVRASQAEAFTLRLSRANGRVVMSVALGVGRS
jgi:hypothetical protein